MLLAGPRGDTFSGMKGGVCEIINASVTSASTNACKFQAPGADQNLTPLLLRET